MLYSFAPNFDEDAILTKDDRNTDEQFTDLFVTEQLRTIERIESKIEYHENAVERDPKELIDIEKDVDNSNLEEEKFYKLLLTAKLAPKTVV
jgi:hypothetical protein